MKLILIFILLTFNLYGKELTFGIVPQQSPQKTLKAWKPIVDYLEKETGLKILFKTERTIPLFEKKLYSGKYDIAYSNPYHYVLAHDRQNHIPLVRFNKRIVGILITNKKGYYISKKDYKTLLK